MPRGPLWSRIAGAARSLRNRAGLALEYPVLGHRREPVWKGANREEVGA